VKILLIEDDAVTRAAIKSQLENPGAGNSEFEGLKITPVGCQTEAETALENDQFQYALIDLKLGQDRMAGFTLLKNISKNFPNIIPIMMTSNDADSTVEDC
jgi:CheY-like chemotaxis protein